MAQERLRTRDMVAYLEAGMDTAGDDPAFIAVALGNIARAYGMVRLAKDTGLTREGLLSYCIIRLNVHRGHGGNSDDARVSRLLLGENIPLGSIA